MSTTVYPHASFARRLSWHSWVLPDYSWRQRTLFTQTSPLLRKWRKHMTSSYLHRSGQTDKWWLRWDNNIVLKRKWREVEWTWQLQCSTFCSKSAHIPRLYLYFLSDYEKCGNTWPVNVTNKKQTGLTAVNNYEHWMECFSRAALRNVHPCPLSSEQIGGKVYWSRYNPCIRSLLKTVHTSHSFSSFHSWHLWQPEII